MNTLINEAEVLEALNAGETIIQLANKIWSVGPDNQVYIYDSKRNFKTLHRPSLPSLIIAKDADRFITFSVGVLEERVGPKTQEEYNSLIEELKVWIRENVQKPREEVKFIAIDSKFDEPQYYKINPKWINDNKWGHKGFIGSARIIIPEKFNQLSCCYSVEEIYNSKKEKKMSKEKFTFIRDIHNITEAFVALGEGYVVSFLPNRPNDGYIILNNKLCYNISGNSVLVDNPIIMDNKYYPAKAYKKETME